MKVMNILFNVALLCVIVGMLLIGYAELSSATFPVFP